MTTGKTISLTVWNFVGKVMSLLFNMLSRFVIAFLPSSRRLLIPWLAVTICSDFGAPQNKVCQEFSSAQFSHSVMSDSLWPMNRSTPSLPVHHQLLEFTQTRIHQVSDAIQPSHPLLSPSPPAFNLSQHQGFFQWAGSLHQVANIGASASALPMNIQY